jgi:uncharacterized protein (TIGR03032 family)
MKHPTNIQLQKLWDEHTSQWRDPAQIVSQWVDASRIDPELLNYSVRGSWWETLQQSGATLLITREYEHLVIALCATESGPRISYYPLPHPSGLTVDRENQLVYIASTRNPNQVYELKPAKRIQPRLDVKIRPSSTNPLMPTRSWFLPGCLYLHDLALIGSKLYGNAVGHNAVVELSPAGGYSHVWWPRCIESHGKPLFERNHLQLNSIAAGSSLKGSFFSASCDRISARRPGHRNFSVDGRGVIFSGQTREPCARGLTRPHSARLRRGKVWVNNSGYGEMGVAEDGRFESVAKLPGWTRGLCFCGPVAFVGTSRVIPRFSQYAPGLDIAASQCAVHALDTTSGRCLGSMSWPMGNQIFAIDWLPSKHSHGFPWSVGRNRFSKQQKNLFYAFA